MRADALMEEFKRGGRLRDLLLGQAEVFLAQLSLTAACNGTHAIVERLARWLLMYDDRSPSREFKVRHEFLAEMLGVRRAGVTDAALVLRRVGLIGYLRGGVTVVDRKGLEKVSCQCYRL